MSFDPILIHPNLGAKAVDPNAPPKDDYKMYGSLGGLAAGLVAAHAARRIPALRAYAPRTAGDVADYALMGSALGTGIFMLAPHVEKVRRHGRAVREFETSTGRRVPVELAHPYLANLLPTAAGAAIGTALAPARSGLRLAYGGGGALIGALAGSPYSNYLQHKREQFFQPHSEKVAQDTMVDPRLLHPILTDRPQTLEESARRREGVINYLGPGAAVGAAAGALAAPRIAALSGHVAGRAAELAPHFRLGGAVFGALGGVAAGAAARKMLLLREQANKHDAAARAYEQQTGQRIPFLARHPFAASLAPLPLGTLAGAALAPKLFEHRGLDRVAGAAVGGLIGATVSPMLTGMSWHERKRLFGGRTPALSTDRFAVGGLEAQNTTQEMAEAERAYRELVGG